MSPPKHVAFTDFSIETQRISTDRSGNLIFIAPIIFFTAFSIKNKKNSTGMSIKSWLSFIAQSIRGFSARKTQLLLELKNNAKKLNSVHRTFTRL